MVEPPPPQLLVYTRPATVWFLQRVVLALTGGWALSSWYRDPAHNRSVGGSDRSQHLLGLAVDVGGDRPAIEATAAAARQLGLVAVDEGDHAHLQMFPAGWLIREGYGWLYRIV